MLDFTMSLFTPDTKTLDCFFKKAKYLMLWRKTLASILIFSALIPAFILMQLTLNMILMIVVIFSWLTLFYLKYNNHEIGIELNNVKKAIGLTQKLIEQLERQLTRNQSEYLFPYNNIDN